MPCFSSAASISVFGHASGTHSQRELRMNHSHFFSACLWSARNGASGWAADIYSRNFSSVTDRSDPMQRDAYAHSTKYAVMNSSAVCLSASKCAKYDYFDDSLYHDWLRIARVLTEGRLQECNQSLTPKHTVLLCVQNHLLAKMCICVILHVGNVFCECLGRYNCSWSAGVRYTFWFIPSRWV